MKKKRNPLRDLRREIKKMAHAQLDALLRGPSELPGGEQGTVLDDICARSLVGYGFSVSIHVRHPMERGQVEEDPSPTPEIVGCRGGAK